MKNVKLLMLGSLLTNLLDAQVREIERTYGSSSGNDKIPAKRMLEYIPTQGQFDIDKLKVLRETKSAKKGKVVSVRQVEPPVLFKAPLVAQKGNTESDFKGKLPTVSEKVISASFVTATATRYEAGKTLVQLCSSGGEQQVVTECWSNLDWNILTATHSFQWDGSDYTYLLLQNDDRVAKLEKPIEYTDLDGFSEVGADYRLVQENGVDREALRFIKAIHQFYQSEELAIRKKYAQREIEKIAKETELRKNPPNKKNISVNFWRVEESKPSQ